MYFKNATIYRFGGIETIGRVTLCSMFAMRELRPCTSLQRKSVGWCNGLLNGNFYLSHGNQSLICFGSNDKLLPSRVIKQASAERIAQIEVEQGHKAGRKQCKEIMEAVEDELLASAFQVTSKTYVWIDFDSKLIVVDTSSINKADAIVELLIKTIDGLTVELFITNGLQLTEIVNSIDCESDFELSDECKLYDANDRGARNVTLKRHELCEELAHHLYDGKSIESIGLIWNERVGFVLNQKAQIKKLDFIGIKAEKGYEVDGSIFMADFALMAGELKQMLTDLLELIDHEAN